MDYIQANSMFTCNFPKFGYARIPIKVIGIDSRHVGPVKMQQQVDHGSNLELVRGDGAKEVLVLFLVAENRRRRAVAHLWRGVQSHQIGCRNGDCARGGANHCRGR